MTNGAVGGGAGLQPIIKDDPDINYFASYMGSTYLPREGYSLFTINDYLLTSEFVSTSGNSSSFQDKFIIEKPKNNRKVLYDSTLPEVVFTSPEDTKIMYGSHVAIDVEASDNIGIGKVEVLVNTHVVCTLYKPPYHCLWKALGTHRGESFSIVVRAYDAANNSDYIQKTLYTY